MKIKFLYSIFFLTLILSPFLSGDIVYTKKGTIIYGIVKKVKKDKIIIEISKGEIEIPTNIVKKIEYDYIARRNLLRKNDLKGHLNLAKFCIDKNMLKEASLEYEYIKKIKNHPVYIYKNLGVIYEQLQELEKAIKNYKIYLTKTNDKEISKKINFLLKKIKNKKTKQYTKRKEGLEYYDKWKIEKWGNKGVISIYKNRNNWLLRLDYYNSKKQKCVITREIPSIKSKKYLTFSVYNPQKQNMSISFIFIATSPLKYYKSENINIHPGWNLDLSLDLNKKYICYTSDKKKIKEKINKTKIKMMSIIVHNSVKNGTIFFDDMFFKE